MKEILGWYIFPFTYIYPFDRNRRYYVKYFGEYKPTHIKRFICYFLDEKLYPIDWEEVPPYEEIIDYENDPNFAIQRPVKIQYYECYTQPDMISQNNIYVRRFLLGVGFIALNEYLVKRFYYFQHIRLLNSMFYNGSSIRRIAVLGWFYYITCFLLVNKDYQKPYN